MDFLKNVLKLVIDGAFINKKQNKKELKEEELSFTQYKRIYNKTEEVFSIQMLWYDPMHFLITMQLYNYIY